MAFQAALAAGVLWDTATQGGANEGVLPDILRVGSVIMLWRAAHNDATESHSAAKRIAT